MTERRSLSWLDTSHSKLCPSWCSVAHRKLTPTGCHFSHQRLKHGRRLSLVEAICVGCDGLERMLRPSRAFVGVLVAPEALSLGTLVVIHVPTGQLIPRLIGSC